MKKKPSTPRGTPPAPLLAHALQAQAEGVLITECRPGPKGLKILFANDSFCAMTGFTPARLRGRAHGTLHVEKTDVENVNRWLPGAQPLQGEGRLIRQDGSTIDVAWSFVALRHGSRVPTHVLATYRNTTGKRKLQDALLQAQRLDAVGRLAGGIAHDFNNLISIVNGYCQILAGRVADRPQALREVQEIHQAGEKAAALTRQLLAFGRRQSLDPRVIDLNQLVRENAGVLERLLGSAGELVLKLTERPAPVRTDPAQFQQVLLNLVINARDALRDHGRVTITTSSRITRAGLNRRFTDIPTGPFVVLTVQDNGTGMDAETQSHLFEPFFTTKAEGKGTGLGLALVYGVVQQSGGFIAVKSTVLVGSTFEILLPLASGPAEPVSHPLPPLPKTHGHETILLVEDDAVVARMVSGILTAGGYRVVTAARAAAAAAAVQREGALVQLLIGPVNSKSGDGARLVQTLESARPGLRVLNTGTPEAPSITAIPRTHQELLPKPFALSELLKSVRRLLDA